MTTKRKTTKKTAKKTTVSKAEIKEQSSPSEEYEHIPMQEIMDRAMMLSEDKWTRKIGRIFNTRYNWSLILGAAILWLITSYSYSSNGNFDMSLYLMGAIKDFCLVAIVGMILIVPHGVYDRTSWILQSAIGTYLLAIITTIAHRNIGHAWAIVGYYILKPLCLFGFLMLIKQVWMLVTNNYKAKDVMIGEDGERVN